MLWECQSLAYVLVGQLCEPPLGGSNVLLRCRDMCWVLVVVLLHDAHWFLAILEHYMSVQVQGLLFHSAGG